MVRFRYKTGQNEGEEERKTDILMTSSVFCAPATRREITVITADQHVHFLAIDALQSAENCTCAHNEMTRMCLLATEEKKALSDRRPSDP